MKNNLSTKNQLKNKQIKTITNMLDNIGMDYPKRDDYPNCNVDEYIQLVGMTFAMNGMDINDFLFKEEYYEEVN